MGILSQRNVLAETSLEEISKFRSFMQKFGELTRGAGKRRGGEKGPGP
jgi:hypothetical protein